MILKLKPRCIARQVAKRVARMLLNDKWQWEFMDDSSMCCNMDAESDVEVSEDWCGRIYVAVNGNAIWLGFFSRRLVRRALRTRMAWEALRRM